MPDPYFGENDVTTPARRFDLITPDDDDPLPRIPKALRFDTAGTVVLRAIDSTADVTINVAAGAEIAVRAQYIRATGTTATIHGYF